MKNIIRFPVIAILIIFSSCNPKVSTIISKNYAPLDFRQEVIVIGTEQPEPEKSEVLGQVKIGDTGFSTKCGFEIVIDKAKLEARKVGGNAIKILQHRPPGLGSSCHRITANILWIEDIEEYTAGTEEETLTDVDYAVLNVYRYGGPGVLITYDLFLGDTFLCRVKSNFKTSIKIKKDGLNTLWAKTEAKSEIPVDIKIGKTYYLRCGLTMGVLVGRPNLELIDNNTGKVEFELLKTNKP
jgi:hypothetical protein